MQNDTIVLISCINFIFLIGGYFIGSRKKIITIKNGEKVEYVSEPETQIKEDYKEEPAYTVEGADIEYVRIKQP